MRRADRLFRIVQILRRHRLVKDACFQNLAGILLEMDGGQHANARIFVVKQPA